VTLPLPTPPAKNAGTGATANAGSAVSARGTTVQVKGEFFYTVPGHAEAGMKGVFTVR
jgi:plastocyanin